VTLITYEKFILNPPITSLGITSSGISSKERGDPESK
jgi:hypothetical protein